jgi:hypothetical protein
MVYTKTTWTTTTRVSAESLNHLESQYDELYSNFMNGHNHDTRYYKPLEATTTFFNSTFMGNGTDMDADLLDGHHASDIIQAGLPTGSMVWWSKAAGSIPTGWYVADGSNGTLDCRDRFVVGTGGAYTVGSYHGNDSVTPQFSTASVASFALTTAEMPYHAHAYSDKYANTPAGYAGSLSYTFAYGGNAGASPLTQTINTGYVGTDGGHTHTASVTYNAEANIPPYYTLYIIEKR